MINHGMTGLFFLTLFFYTTAWAIENLYSFKELRFQPSRDIVFWDLDHTLIEPVLYEGSDPWFQSLWSLASDQATKNNVIELYNKVQERAEVRLTDPELLKLWSDWTQQKLLMFGLTARGTVLDSVTERQLKDVGLKFKYDGAYLIDEHYDCFRNQILFASGASKGATLRNFLLQHPELMNKKIIFIDDSSHNIQSVDEALQRLGLDYEVYHYQVSSRRYHDAKRVPCP
jgi:hypothetical protein